MPRPRKLSDEQRNRLLIIALWRRKAPSNKQLAFEMGVSQRTIEAVMTELVRGCSVPVNIPLDKPCSTCGGKRETASHGYCRACFAAYNRANRVRHSDLTDEQRRKANARAYANVAQRRGKLIAQPCEKCGSQEAEKHHEDYSLPLDVRWLCRACHLKEHENVEIHSSDDVPRETLSDKIEA